MSPPIGKYKIIITMVLLCIGHCFIDFMIGVWPVFKMMANLDLAKAGYIVAIAAFLGEGSQLIFGSLSDKGYKKQLLVFSLIIGSGTLLVSYSHDYFILFSFYLMTCIGSGAFHPTAASFVNQMVPARRALMMGLFATAGNVGLGTSQLVFSKTSEFFDGQTIYLAVPALILALGLLFFRFPKIEVVSTKHHGIKDLFQFFKRDDLRNLYISQVANQTILWGTIFLLPNVLQNLGHANWICLGGGHSCLILGSALMMVPAGYLADKFSSRNVLLVANSLSCMMFYLVLFVPDLPPTVTLVMLGLLGSCLGLVNPVAVALGNKLVPTQPGMISAFLMGMVWCVSEALGPGGMGLLSSLFTDNGPVKAMAVLGGFYLLSIYATYLLPQEVPASKTDILSSY